MSTSLIARPDGNFDFSPGSGTFCNEVIPHDGYAVAHAVFMRPTPLVAAFSAINKYLAGLGRPMAALCGAELRIAEPLSFAGFGAFNAMYVALLDAYGLRVAPQADATPLGTMTRSNLSPGIAAAKPEQPSVYAFSYVVPGARPGGRRSFVSSGLGELAGAGRDSIIRLGDTTPDGMREKARWVMQTLFARIGALGLAIQDISHVNVYCVHSADSYMRAEVLEPLGAHAGIGAHWHFCRPPIAEVEFEVDLKGVLTQTYL